VVIELSRHLIIAYETASSPELREALSKHPYVEWRDSFVLLVPATPTRHLLMIRNGRAKETAQKLALSAKNYLETAGLVISKAVVGDPDPLKAIRNELAVDSGYASIIICTHPADVSRWLKADVLSRAQTLGLPVTHVLVRSVAESAGYR
jgi:GABA permease